MTVGRSQTTRWHPARLLCHPVVVLAVVVTAVNDHVLKGAGVLPGVVTGKLSDVSGLFFFPILLAVLLYLACRLVRWEPSKQTLVVTAGVSTAVVFGALNLWEPVNGWANRFWGTHSLDPTDLLCLPMVWLSCRFMASRWVQAPARRRRRDGALRWPQAAAILLAAAVSVATSYSTSFNFQNYPTWHVERGAVQCVEDVEVRAWFAKTGRHGTGLVVHFTAEEDHAREVGVHRAVMYVRGGEEDMVVRSGRGEAVADPTGAVYLPFHFDNDAAWREERNVGEVDLGLVIDGRRVAVQLSEVRQIVGDGYRTAYHTRRGHHGTAYEYLEERYFLDEEGVRRTDDGYALRVSLTGDECSWRDDE